LINIFFIKYFFNKINNIYKKNNNYDILK